MVSFCNGAVSSQLEPISVSNRDRRTYPFTSINTVVGSHLAASEVPRLVEYSNSAGANFFRHPDLVKVMFDHFKKEYHSPRERRDLISFMLISKVTFRYPARILWSRIGRQFVAALQLLDLEVWDNGSHRRLFGPPLLDALEQNKDRLAEHVMWKKFLYYADAIEFVDTNTVFICPGTITLLAHLLPPSDALVFPCLRHLIWTESLTDSNDLLHMLGPSLSVLHLHIYDFFDEQYTSTAFMDWATRMIHAASHLSHNIRVLVIDAMGSLILNPSVLAYFCTLHQLAITQASPNSGQDVMAPPMAFQSLEDLEIVSYHGSKGLLNSLPYVISFMAHSLRMVNLQSIAGSSALDNTSFVENFQPLLSLQQLMEVRIGFMLVDFEFTDRDLITVARAWPNIVEMAFAFSRLRTSPVPRLQTLGLVAAHCRSLKKITLPFLVGPGSGTTFEISAPPSHPLEEIRTHSMTWDKNQSGAITSRLKQAFPSLTGVFSNGSIDDEHELLWAILPPYILSSQVAAYPISVPHADNL
ncbi:hypothetical protein GSI_04603 [Ganoderma sinense ZZ0214-1]|uniref:Uncharacterized protein n=1 Tax=Ganoderma sinense ZZ0214-1 TaxID=1077348 RepID=A0A2G8SHB6_9APHY|nr:hypothetical protein GSI_04603 [Ganoderma sinense ZZ0214-1]